MAVTLVDYPNPLIVWSASYPMEITLSSDKVGQEGITVHKFYNTISINGVEVGTVWYSSLVPPTVTFDIHKVAQHYISLSNKIDPLGTGTLAAIPEVALGGPTYWGFSNQQVTVNSQVGESYIEGGVQVTNPGSSWDNVVVRGKSDDNTSKWKNMVDQFGAGTYAYQFSSYEYFCFPINLQKFLPITTDLDIKIDVLATNGTTYNFQNAELSPTEVADNEVIYVSLYVSPPTMGGALSKQITISIYDGAALVETFVLNQMQEICEQSAPVISVMFQNRYFQWSNVSFPMKNYHSIETTNQSGYLRNEGKVAYATKGRNVIRVNTDYIDESSNWLFEDLILSQEIFYVDNTLDLLPDYTDQIRLYLRDSTFNKKTVKNDKLIQYSFTFELSLDDFTP